MIPQNAALMKSRRVFLGGWASAFISATEAPFL
jgi:hypothetical protein